MPNKAKAMKFTLFIYSLYSFFKSLEHPWDNLMWRITMHDKWAEELYNVCYHIRSCQSNDSLSRARMFFRNKSLFMLLLSVLLAITIQFHSPTLAFSRGRNKEETSPHRYHLINDHPQRDTSDDSRYDLVQFILQYGFQPR